MNPLYHTEREFLARLESRRRNPIPPDPILTFFHISCMNNWEMVVLEQLRLLKYLGISYVASFVLGTREQVERCKEIADIAGIILNILGTAEDLSLYEGPTLNTLYDWAIHYPQGAVFYIHTTTSLPRQLTNG